MILPGSDISVFIMDHEDRHINMGEYVCQNIHGPGNTMR